MGIPDYLQEEIERFKYNREHGILDIANEGNVYAFVGMAYLNGRITEEEADELREMLDNL